MQLDAEDDGQPPYKPPVEPSAKAPDTATTTSDGGTQAESAATATAEQED